MISLNRGRKTWEKDVDLFIVRSNFCLDLFERGGIPRAKTVINPVCISDPLASTEPVILSGPGTPKVLFVGRLSREKGVHTLLKAWSTVRQQIAAELHIVGDGPMRSQLASLADDASVILAGTLSREAVMRAMFDSSVVVLPSECYETFGRVVIEAFACGRPVVVSRIGGPMELVREGASGLLFDPGDANDLAGKLLTLLKDDGLRSSMGRNCRSEYLDKYTPGKNYPLLMKCYEQAIENHRQCSTN